LFLIARNACFSWDETFNSVGEQNPEMGMN